MSPFTIAAVTIAGVTVVRSVIKYGVMPVLRPKIRGVAGERTVNKLLRRAGKTLGNCERFRDIMIPGKRQTSQIDNGLITPYGIFVVETKNYTGKVMGSNNGLMWRHIFGKGRQKEFLNPVMQNKGHVEALRMLLKEYPGVPIYSIVAFSDQCEVTPKGLYDVVNFSALEAAIQYRVNGKTILSDEQIKDIKSRISKANIRGRRDREEHITRASLAARGARNGLDEEFLRAIEEARKQPIISFDKPPTPVAPKREMDPEKILLTDEGALMKINGRTGSIDDFFESAKRTVDDESVPHGAPFHHFVCPYTGTYFPPSEARSFYNGLWSAYLTAHPELVSYIREHGAASLNSSFRTGRVLSAYVEDEAAFKASTRETAWYKNLEQHQAQKRRPLKDQIQTAEGRRSTGSVKGKTFQGYSH